MTTGWTDTYRDFGLLTTTKTYQGHKLVVEQCAANGMYLAKVFIHTGREVYCRSAVDLVTAKKFALERAGWFPRRG
jgi:hypothetical protein